MQLSPAVTCGMLLVASNVFMTFAWEKPWWIAALASWAIALFEYLLMVPANRIGFAELTLPQLKIRQEAIRLGVFVPFAILYTNQPVNFLFRG